MTFRSMWGAPPKGLGQQLEHALARNEPIFDSIVRHDSRREARVRPIVESTACHCLTVSESEYDAWQMLAETEGQPPAYRSRTSSMVSAREQHTAILSLRAFSSEVCTRSR